MLKKLGLPVFALLGALAFIHPTPAQAGVRFGVGVYAAPPVYSYPAPVYPYAASGYYGAPAYPYYDGYAYPSVGFGLEFGGYGGGYYNRGYYGHNYGGGYYGGNRGYAGHGYTSRGFSGGGGHRR